MALFDKPIDGKRLCVKLSPQFQQRAEGIFRINGQSDRLIETQLTNFQAAITSNTCLDDGLETKREFGLEATLSGRSFRFAVPAALFASMEWAISQIGPSAIIFPNQREYARTALQTTSFTAEERRVFTHTGWRDIDGQRCFLHAAGAIGPSGNVFGVAVQLPNLMTRYQLRLPETEEVVRSAARASLLLFQLGQSVVMFPLIAAVARSIFGAADFALHLVGETGAFKSELAALAQQFFGPDMDRRHLPGS